MIDHVTIPVRDLARSRVLNRDLVHQFYTYAMEAGASDNGAPGPRTNYTPNYYAAFVLDPDRHNIEAMHDKWDR